MSLPVSRNILSAYEKGTRFFFQPEDGIRCGHVTGVQTCALPILSPAPPLFGRLNPSVEPAARLAAWRATVRRNRVAPLARRLCAALLPGRRAVSAGLRRRRSRDRKSVV